MLDGFERIGAIEPQNTKSGTRYSQPDAEFLSAIAEFRKSGYGEALGFTVYDALIYMRHLEALARDEVDVISEKLPRQALGRRSRRPDRARARPDARSAQRDAREAARGRVAPSPRRLACPTCPRR